MKLPVVDLWCCTYPKDVPWLRYLFRSIDLHVTGFRRLVLVLEKQDPVPTGLPDYVVVKRCRRYRGTDIEGYWGQSIEGLRAHEYSNADVIWFAEADWVFVRDIDLQRDREYQASRPLILHNDWNKVGAARKWRQPTERILAPLSVPFETMRRPPFWYPRWFIKEVWQQFGGDRLFELVRNGKGLPLSQFNVLDSVAMELNWVNGGKLFAPVHMSREKSKIPKPCVAQFWSHDGVDHPGVQLELAKLGLLDDGELAKLGEGDARTRRRTKA
jgi:hypothetical protein